MWPYTVLASSPSRWIPLWIWLFITVCLKKRKKTWLNLWICYKCSNGIFLNISFEDFAAIPRIRFFSWIKWLKDSVYLQFHWLIHTSKLANDFNLAHPFFTTYLQFQDIENFGKLRYHIERQLKNYDKLWSGTVCCITIFQA